MDQLFADRVNDVTYITVFPGHFKRLLSLLRHCLLSPYFRNLPLLHITIRLHLIWRLLKFMQWLARKQYLLRRRVIVGDNIIAL